MSCPQQEENNTMNTQDQENVPTLEWLYSQGWSLREAAMYLGIDPGHLSRVLKGERKSRRLMEKVALLPKKRLSLRRNDGGGS